MHCIIFLWKYGNINNIEKNYFISIKGCLVLLIFFMDVDGSDIF